MVHCPAVETCVESVRDICDAIPDLRNPVFRAHFPPAVCVFLKYRTRKHSFGRVSPPTSSRVEISECENGNHCLLKWERDIILCLVTAERILSVLHSNSRVCAVKCRARFQSYHSSESVGVRLQNISFLSPQRLCTLF